VAARRKAGEVDLEDIRRVYSMFMDLNRSTTYLKEHQKQYLFSDDTDKMEVE
jgi:RuvB-like protein 2